MDHQMFAQLLGNYGEFVGAVAIVVTLVYLAVQVRQSRQLLEENRKLALSAAYQSRTGFRIDLAKDYSLDDAWLALQAKLRGGYQFQSTDVLIQNFEALTTVEKIKYMLWLEAITHSADNALFQMELGLADSHIREVAERTIRLQYPIWEHTGVLIPPRVMEWYQRDQSLPT